MDYYKFNTMNIILKLYYFYERESGSGIENDFILEKIKTYENYIIVL